MRVNHFLGYESLCVKLKDFFFRFVDHGQYIIIKKNIIRTICRLTRNLLVGCHRGCGMCVREYVFTLGKLIVHRDFT